MLVFLSFVAAASGEEESKRRSSLQLQLDELRAFVNTELAVLREEVAGLKSDNAELRQRLQQPASKPGPRPTASRVGVGVSLSAEAGLGDYLPSPGW